MNDPPDVLPPAHSYTSFALIYYNTKLAFLSRKFALMALSDFVGKIRKDKAPALSKMLRAGVYKY